MSEQVKGSEKVHFATERHPRLDEEPDHEFIFTVDQKNATTEILVEGIPAEAVIDSGASCNIVSEQEWKKLRDQGIQCTTHSV